MKLGMVFEGGASRTAFSCGVMDAFLEEELMPDYFIGVSAGIAFGVSYLSKQKGRNLKLLEEYMADKRYMGLKYLFDRKKKSYYNIGFVFDEVPNKLLPFDYETFAGYKGVVEACVTNIHTGKAEYLKVPQSVEMKDTLVASCSLPILFQPVKIGRHYYLDGGIADSIPFRHALEEGCDKLIVVLTREHGYVKTTEKAIRIKKLDELEQQGKVFVIAPETTLGVGRTESDPKKLRELYEEGRRIGQDRMKDLRKYLECQDL